MSCASRDPTCQTYISMAYLVSSRMSDGGDINDIELVRNLVKIYISRPRCLIFLVISCETDFENQGAGRLALEIDPDGQRIVGVLTRPDRIESAAGDKWATLLRNERNRLLNGWFCVKQPDRPSLSKNYRGRMRARGKTRFSLA
ncbi:hypothetical protein JB92DRAFT_463705 [Gautieria morchelliformis]|nr:hypothetical protein JB92DRAFT_463705 [Gautieria morchelliformis]